MEVIDIRTLVPLDVETIVESVKKTSRAVVLHEAARRMGYGAEIAAAIQEKCFWHLDQPVVRVGAKNTPTPTSPPLEDAVVPQPAEIAETIRKVAMSTRSPRERQVRRAPARVASLRMSDYDLVVLGGGPGGYASALYAASAGLSVALVEKQKIGWHLPEPRLHPGQGAAARRGGVPDRRARRRTTASTWATVPRRRRTGPR